MDYGWTEALDEEPYAYPGVPIGKRKGRVDGRYWRSITQPSLRQHLPTQSAFEATFAKDKRPRRR